MRLVFFNKDFLKVFVINDGLTHNEYKGLTLGKSYEVLYTYNQPYNAIYIIDDNYSPVIVNRICFESIEKLRDNKIDQILK